MQLTLKNSGSVPLRVSPGFHPYFYRGGQAPTVANVTYKDLAEFAETKFIDGDIQHLAIASRQLTLQSSGLPRYAVWTDQLGDYLCVEPTQSGNAFLEDMSRTDEVQPGSQQVYRFAIVW